MHPVSGCTGKSGNGMMERQEAAWETRKMMKGTMGKEPMGKGPMSQVPKGIAK